MPDPIPLRPRVDTTAADAGTLEAMGRLHPQPTPTAPPPPPPVPQPGADPVDEQEAVALAAALADAGIDTTAGDQAAVRALATLDPATVETVKAWLKAKKDKPQTPTPSK